MKIRLTGLFFVAFFIGLSACKKNSDVVIAGLKTHLNLIDASADTVNFYLNGSRLNKSSNLYPAGSSGYFEVAYGAQSYQLKKVFDPTKNVVQTLFSIPLTLDTGKYYSLFITDETAAHAFHTIDTLQADTVPGKCYVRFVNATPDGGSLDFAAGTVKFSNQGFAAASGFRQVDTSGLKPIMLYQSGTATPFISGHYPLAEHKSYTFYSRGKPNGTGNAAFSLGVTVNYN